MKIKLLTIILAFATLLTLTACGGDNATEAEKEVSEKSEITESTESSDNSDEIPSDTSENTDTSSTVPEEESIYPLAGTWKRVQKTADVEENYFVIDNNGYLTEYYIYSDGETSVYEYSLDNDYRDVEWTDSVKLYFQAVTGRKGQSMTFEKVSGHYTYTEYDSRGRISNYYYREEDMADYDVIELTSENVGQYIEDYCYFTHNTDDYGDITSITAWNEIRFKEGLGAPSYIFGELTYKINYRTATYNPETKEIVWGEIYETDDSNDFTKKVQCCGIGDYVSNTGWNKNYSENGDGTYAVESVDILEITGAEKIIGKVYVPKDWNK